MSDAVQEAQRLYKDSLDAQQDQRRRIEEDLRFTDPADPQQWDEQLKRSREQDPGGARPCLVFDQCGQYIANVAGQVEQRPPSLHAIPATNGDKRVAEKLDGLFRNIEHVSRAQQHYARALTSAARAGVGYLVLRPEFTDRALGYQEPRIGSEGDPLRVVFDPWSVELDGSDATHGVILTPYSHREWDRKFKGKEKVSFGEPEKGHVSDEREHVYTGEVWRVEDRTVNCIVCIDPSTGEETTLSEDAYWENAKRDGTPWEVVFDDEGKPRQYKDKQRVVRWALMSGADMLSEEIDYPASGIGLVPVYGYVGWANNRMTYCGIGRRAMAAQRSYNYHMSELHAHMGQGPKAPWLTPVRALRDLKDLWDRASVDSRAYLPYHDVDEAGQPIAPPTRMPLAMNLANHMQGAEQAKRDIEASIGMYQANLGAPSNETSGVAIDSRKEQGEASTAHFPAHLSASISRIGLLAVEMIPRLIDTRRQLRILGIDNTPSQIVIDPDQSEPVQENEQGLSINPSRGTYDAYCVVGAAFATQRSQAQTAYTEMMRANPELTPAIAPLWAQTLDVPHADKLAQVLTAMAPPAVQAILNPDANKQPSTGELTAKVEQLQQALQEAVQLAHDAQAEADELRASKEAEEEKNAIAAYDAATKRMVGLKDAITPEQIQMLVVQTINNMMSHPDPLPGEEPEPGPEAWQGQPLPMGDGPGMDGTPMHEMAEPAAMEAQEQPDDDMQGGV